MSIASSLDLLALSSLLLCAWCWRLRAQVRTLARVSTRDPLTGLPNGLVFETEHWPAALRERAPLCVLYVDLDQLKENNDRFGHATGDRYIVRAAALLRKACRRGIDPVFRLHSAGDEFVVLLRGDDALHGGTVAAHILSSLSSEGISASIGVAATASAEYLARTALLDEAEQAMRQAKQEGKGRVVSGKPRGNSAEPSAAVVSSAVEDFALLPARRPS